MIWPAPPYKVCFDNYSPILPISIFAKPILKKCIRCYISQKYPAVIWPPPQHYKTLLCSACTYTTSSHSSTDYKQPFINRLQAAIHQPTTLQAATLRTNYQNQKQKLYTNSIKTFLMFCKLYYAFKFMSTGIAV